tara:strand:+ start:308 stop:505 length:198 start_codon:yes stop_codon:yes gene_type:complete
MAFKMKYQGGGDSPWTKNSKWSEKWKRFKRGVSEKKDQLARITSTSGTTGPTDYVKKIAKRIKQS